MCKDTIFRIQYSIYLIKITKFVKSTNKNIDMKKIVFLTGAGMSVESGFKTFRGNDGLWEDYPVEKSGYPRGLGERPRVL